MFPLDFVAGPLQGHWWGFISQNHVIWTIFFLINVFIALKGTDFLFLFLIRLTHILEYLWHDIQTSRKPDKKNSFYRAYLIMVCTVCIQDFCQTLKKKKKKRKKKKRKNKRDTLKIGNGLLQYIRMALGKCGLTWFFFRWSIKKLEQAFRLNPRLIKLINSAKAPTVLSWINLST